MSRRCLLAAAVAALALPMIPAQVAAAAPATTTTLISKSSAPASRQGPLTSDSPSESADGQWTAFVSRNELDPVSGTNTSQVYVRNRITQQATWVSDLKAVAGAPGGGDPHFYQATQPSVSSDGHLIAFTARPSNSSISALTQPDVAGSTSAPQPAGDLAVVLEDWFPGEVLKIRVTDSDGACGPTSGDSVAFAGTPTMVVLPAGPQITLGLASSGPGCGNNEVDLNFANGGGVPETITLTGIRYLVGSAVSLGTVAVTTVPEINGSGSVASSNANVKSGGGNSITAASHPSIAPGGTVSAANWTIHLNGWARDTTISVAVDDHDGGGCATSGGALTDGVVFNSQPSASSPTTDGPTALEPVLIGDSAGACGVGSGGLARGSKINVTTTNSGTEPRDLTIGNVTYTVGTGAAFGDVTVTTSPVLANSGLHESSNMTICCPIGSAPGTTVPPKFVPAVAPAHRSPSVAAPPPADTACRGGCQVYVRDTVAKTTRLVSAQDLPPPVGGGPPPLLPLAGDNYQPAINQDGAQIALTSTACELTTGLGRTCQPAVLVRDTKDPSNPRTMTVSLAIGSSVTGCEGCFSGQPSISADGRFVAFESNAELTPFASGRTQVYLHDRDVTASGRFDQAGQGLTNTRLVSARPSLAPSDPGAFEPSISGDGRLIAFVSGDPSITAPATANGIRQVYVHDRFADLDVNLVDIAQTSFGGSSGATDPFGWTFSFDEPVGPPGAIVPADHFKLVGTTAPVVAISAVVGADGTTVAVKTPALDPATVARGVVLPGAVAFPPLVPNPLLTASFAPVNAGPTLTGVGPSPTALSPAVRFSFDGPVTVADPGRFELFDRNGKTFSASRVAPAGTSAVDASFTQAQLLSSVGADVRAGAVAGGQEAELLAPFLPFSVLASQGANGPGDFLSEQPSISGDGRTVAFSSNATNLAAGKPTPYDQRNVYGHDLASGDTQLLSVSSAGALADDGSYLPSTSGNGRFTAFQSFATNLDVDTNGSTSDVFLSDRFPVLQIKPDPGLFGSVAVGSSSNPVTFTVTNHGAGPAVVAAVSVTGPEPGDFSLANDTCSGVTLYPQAPSNTCTMTVVFSPAAGGGRSAALQVTSDAPVTPVTDPLSGTGLIPALTLSPVPADFGTVQLGSNSTQVITATNTGQAPAKISATGVSGADAGDFSVTGDGCSGKTLKPTESCQVAMQFAPTAAGSRNALFRVQDNAPGNPHTDRLTGTGLAPVPPPPPPPTCTPNQLRIQPALGPPGSVATVIGTGWGINQSVVVSWSTGLDGKKVVKADATGSFVTTLLILHRDFLGPRQAVATQAALTCQQPFLAVPGTAEPPGFLLRR